jgi:YD repeat-containing protein
MELQWKLRLCGDSCRYDPLGNLTNITYQTSPSITLHYDAVNRLTSMVDAMGETSYGYDAAGQLSSEDGPWPDDTVSFTYNNGLRASVSVSAPNGAAWRQTYGCDSAKRLTAVTSPAGSFGYTCDSARALQLGTISLPSAACITNTYDNVARLVSIAVRGPDLSTTSPRCCQLNQASQRTQQVFSAGNYLDDTYDNIGQLQTARSKESGGTTNRLHEQLGYTYGAGGNLNSRTNDAP